MQNEPNFRQDDKRNKYFVEKELWQIDQQRGSTKRSQFASLSHRGGRTGPEERRRQPRVAGANRAKRTQFGPTTETAGVPNGENVQNKPNWGPLGEIWRAKTRETNPIRPRRASVGGKLCETNPIPVTDSKSRPPDAQPSIGSRAGSTKRPFVASVRMCRRPRSKRAKQSQFAGAGPAARVLLCSVVARATADAGRWAARLAFRSAPCEIVSAFHASLYVLRRSGTGFADMKVAGQCGGISQAKTRTYDEIR